MRHDAAYLCFTIFSGCRLDFFCYQKPSISSHHKAMTKLRFPLRLGTRNSKLALCQAELVRTTLLQAYSAMTGDQIIIVPLQSAGDWRPEQGEQNFAALGGTKGLFAKELEAALQEERIDLAVHSAKDLETVLAPGLELAAFLPRADVRDAFVSWQVKHPSDLPVGAKVGTSSLRRAAQLLHRRPDLVISPLRGNVDTRLRKLQDGQADATILAACGLQRLNITGNHIHPLAPEAMVPAVAQGALAVETRSADTELNQLLQGINCAQTQNCVTLERLFLHHLNGSCRTPVAALATQRSSGLYDFSALVAMPNGQNLQRRQLTLTEKTAPAQIAALAEEWRAALPPELLS